MNRVIQEGLETPRSLSIQPIKSRKFSKNNRIKVLFGTITGLILAKAVSTRVNGKRRPLINKIQETTRSQVKNGEASELSSMKMDLSMKVKPNTESTKAREEKLKLMVISTTESGKMVCSKEKALFSKPKELFTTVIGSKVRNMAKV